MVIHRCEARAEGVCATREDGETEPLKYLKCKSKGVIGPDRSECCQSSERELGEQLVNNYSALGHRSPAIVQEVSSVHVFYLQSIQPKKQTQQDVC